VNRLRWARTWGIPERLYRRYCRCMIDELAVRTRYEALRPCLDERGRRLFAAVEAQTAGYGGVAAVSRVTGIARSTIDRGLKDLAATGFPEGSVRRAGGGRRALTTADPTLLEDLRRLLEPATMGDPMRPLLWVSKSHAKLAEALCAMGHSVDPSSIPKLLGELKYSRQVNRKTKEGSHHPDRNGQFEHVNAQAMAFQAANQPVISVDTKKKELIGDFKNPGSDYRPQGCPEAVNIHDFPDKELGKVVPYGVYDIAADAGLVSVGIDHDTAEFAVNSIRRWHDKMGRARYPKAPADDHRRRRRLQRNARTAVEDQAARARRRDWIDPLGVPLSTRHVEVEQDRASPVLSHHPKLARQTATTRLTVVELIAATTTKTGLQVRCELDTNVYPKGIKVSDADMAVLNITGHTFHPEWNYTISPRSPTANLKQLFFGVALH